VNGHGAALCCQYAAINGSIMEFLLSVECVSIGSTVPNEDKNSQLTRETGKNLEAALHNQRSNNMTMGYQVSLQLFGACGRSS